MKNTIHPTAVIHEKAILGEDNFIGPYCLIGPNVTIGNNNRLEAYVSIGTAGEHRDYFHTEPGPVVMGSNNVIREFVTINGGTSSKTRLGSSIVMLRGSHIGHDVYVADKCTLSCNVLIGGHSIICEGANLGLSAVVHQNRVIGAFSMIGMNSSVTKNVMPFVIAFGSPCNPQKVNRVGLLRNGVSEADLIIFEKWFSNFNGLYDRLVPINHKLTNHVTNFDENKEMLYKLLGLS